MYVYDETRPLPRSPRLTPTLRSLSFVRQASAQPAKAASSAQKAPAAPKISSEEARALYRDMFLGRCVVLNALAPLVPLVCLALTHTLLCLRQ